MALLIPEREVDWHWAIEIGFFDISDVVHCH